MTTPALAAPARRPMKTPHRLRAYVVAVILLAVALGTVLAVAVTGVRDGLAFIGHRAGPQVIATQDVYFALNDMDAQIANVLLVGDDRNLGVGRDKALQIYADRRTQVAGDLQQAAAMAGDDPRAAAALRTALDGLGRYETLAGQAVLLDGQRPHAAARPPQAALEHYRQATDLLKSVVLPAVDTLSRSNAAALDATYQDRRAAAMASAAVVAVLGVTLVGVLLALQLSLVRTFRRLLNEWLAVATVAAFALTVTGAGLLVTEAEHLRGAKKDAFDSVMALTRARAVSYDANADESRFLVDPSRADRYQRAFLEKSQQLAGFSGAGLESYDSLLDSALQIYEADHGDVRFTGFFGTAFGNITFPGERELAEQTVTAFRDYQRDDRKMRALRLDGDLRAAVAFNTSYAEGNSNYHFDRYDKALERFIALNHRYFEASIRDGEAALSGWTLIPAAGALLVAVLTLVGVRPRLNEYR
ncbi:hypothetical protein ACIBQ1_38435 [Nonomuraea sp. NPDC050153]|uniref:hypothetical protein n=1 Tax=Nonomuraea sp. NPDC050153 TaxID=3364359 RepID=UPI0037AA7833